MISKHIFSKIQIKSVDEDAREIVGIASTPATDRYDDIVLPEGAKFTLPVPLLWQHFHDEPIGNVVEASITKNGILIKAKLAQAGEGAPSQLRARLDEAWHSIKTKLVRGLSIGFIPIEYEQNESGSGYTYTKWDWLELSAVTVPANAEATIQLIKSIANPREGTGRGCPSNDLSTAHDFISDIDIEPETVLPTVNAVTAETTKTAVAEKTQVNTQDMNILDQITSFESLRNEKTVAINEIMNKALEDSRVITKEEDTLIGQYRSEIDQIETHLKRVHEMSKLKAKESKAVEIPDESENPDENAATLRSGTTFVKMEEPLEKGIEFTRYVKCLAAAQGSPLHALKIAENKYPRQKRIQTALKAAISAGTTTDPAWAGALVEYNLFARDFIEFLRPQTILGKFGTNGIPSLMNVPFNIRVPRQVSGGAGYWVGQGAAKPLTKFDFDTISLGFAKVANIAVLTDELVRFSNPSADRLVRNALAGALIERLDQDFIDPEKAEVANISPASITNGATSHVSTGDPDKDTSLLFGDFIAANIAPTSGVWIMSALTALALSEMQTPLGIQKYPGMTMLGGTFKGLPVIVSQYAGNYLILADASEIYLADDNAIVIDASREASLEMESAPTHNSTTPTGAQLVSMFQTNSIAIRAERFINWKRRRDAAVAYITDVNYGGQGS